MCSRFFSVDFQHFIFKTHGPRVLKPFKMGGLLQHYILGQIEIILFEKLHFKRGLLQPYILGETGIVLKVGHQIVRIFGQIWYTIFKSLQETRTANCKSCYLNPRYLRTSCIWKISLIGDQIFRPILVKYGFLFVQFLKVSRSKTNIY